jgi:hypothetical protein
MEIRGITHGAPLLDVYGDLPEDDTREPVIEALEAREQAWRRACRRSTVTEVIPSLKRLR